MLLMGVFSHFYLVSALLIMFVLKSLLFFGVYLYIYSFVDNFKNCR